MWILFIFYKNITFQQPLVAAKINTVGLIVASKSENITYSIQNTCTCNHHYYMYTVIPKQIKHSQYTLQILTHTIQDNKDT